MVGAVEPLQELLGTYGDLFGGYELAMFGAKLGLKKPEKRDQKLISDALDLLGLVETDMTLWFRALADVPVAADATDEARLAALQQSYYDRATTTTEVREQTLAWLQRWTARLAEEAAPADERKAAMNRVNPKFVLRNYTAQLAIDEAEKGDGGLVMQTLDVMRRPYDEQPGCESFAEKRPEWARTRAGCSMLSCSS